MIRPVTDKPFRLSAIMSVYAAENTVLEAIESVYPHVDELVIAWGRDECFRWKCDGTRDLLRALPDPDRKITIAWPPGLRAIDMVWSGSRQESRNKMRRACCEHVTGTHLLILDGDEIWDGLGVYRQDLEAGWFSGGTPLTVTFWHDEHHWIHGGSYNRWGTLPDPTADGAISPLSRLFPWQPDYQWSGLHVMPRTAAGAEVWPTAWNAGTPDGYSAASWLEASCMLYHLGHALPPEKMAEKARFYEQFDGARGRTRWAEWDGRSGDTGDGIVKPVHWELPPLVKRAFAKIRQACPV